MKFSISSLQDPVSRERIQQKLQEVTWNLTVLSVTDEVARLSSKRFCDGIIFPYREFGYDTVEINSVWELAIDICYYDQFDCYDYKVTKACLVSNAQPSPVAVPVKSVPSHYQHLITQLQPAPSWTILIDETGDRFRNDDVTKGNLAGKMVALLIQDNFKQPLPAIPIGFHACEPHYQSDVPQVIHDVLASKCGIIGIDMEALPQLHGELWLTAVQQLIDLIIAMIPISGTTKLNFKIEERSMSKATTSGILRSYCENALLQLSRHHPDRAKYIQIESVAVISKEGSEYNGYVDALAYCWGSFKQGNNKLIQSLCGSSFLSAKDAKDLHNIIMLNYGDLPSPQRLNELLSQLPNNYQQRPLLNFYIKQLAEKYAHQPQEWERFLEEIRRHLESKKIDQRLLARQIEFLRISMPREQELDDVTHLLFLTANLAEANHLGQLIDGEGFEHFNDLCDQLIDDKAPLVAWATLNLAVACTNAFDFTRAREVMKRWQHESHRVTGRQYYGQIESTLGQLHSFLGEYDEAHRHFDAAIVHFRQMNNVDDALSDIEQTTTYKLITMISEYRANTPEFDVLLEDYFNLPLERAVIVTTADADKRYKHHVLLKALAYGNYPAARQAYLEQQAQWLTGKYHPWELIDFYRALLVDDTAWQRKYFTRAYRIAMSGDATMKVIAAVILGSLLLLEPTKLEEYQALVEDIAVQLPALGKRLDILREQPTAKRPPRELAYLVLPFNFS